MKLYLLIVVLFMQLNANEPKWIIDPSMGGKYVGAIGCAKDINNTTHQERIAYLRAKGSISQEIQTKVEDTIHHKSTLEDDIFEEEFSFESKQTSCTTFEIKKMATFLYKNGLLCVWIIKK